MMRKGLNDLNGKFFKTRPARQYAPFAYFFSKTGTEPHWNPEGPQNAPHARKRLISLGFKPWSTLVYPRLPTFSRPIPFLFPLVSGHRNA